MDVRAARGVTVRKLPTAAGPADYVRSVDRLTIGVEGKKDGTSIRDHLRGPAALPGRVPEQVAVSAYCHRAARHGDRQGHQMQTLGIQMLFRSRAQT